LQAHLCLRGRLATHPDHGADPWPLLADHALYRAKRGRGRAVA